MINVKYEAMFRPNKSSGMETHILTKSRSSPNIIYHRNICENLITVILEFVERKVPQK